MSGALVIRGWLVLLFAAEVAALHHWHSVLVNVTAGIWLIVAAGETGIWLWDKAARS